MAAKFIKGGRLIKSFILPAQKVAFLVQNILRMDGKIIWKSIWMEKLFNLEFSLSGI